MFDELNDIINPDDESQEKFKNFKINFRKKAEQTAKGELRRARTTALILGSSAIISIVFLVFAFSERTQADMARQEVEYLQSQLDECRDLQSE